VLFDPKLERMAKDGNEMPDGLEYPDQIMYMSLRMLYAQLRLGIIDRDAAIREKKQLVREYECYSFQNAMGKEWVQVIKATELARAEYMKNRTLGNADKLMKSICLTERKEAL
jgi:hypothetical protein